VTTGAIRRAKFPSNHHHQQTNIHLLQAGCPSCRPTNNVKVLKGRNSHSTDLFTPSSSRGLPALSLTTKGSRIPCERVAITLISPLMPVPCRLKKSHTNNASELVTWSSILYNLLCRKIHRQTDRQTEGAYYCTVSPLCGCI